MYSYVICGADCSDTVLLTTPSGIVTIVDSYTLFICAVIYSADYATTCFRSRYFGFFAQYHVVHVSHSYNTANTRPHVTKVDMLPTIIQWCHCYYTVLILLPSAPFSFLFVHNATTHFQIRRVIPRYKWYTLKLGTPGSGIWTFRHSSHYQQRYPIFDATPYGYLSTPSCNRYYRSSGSLMDIWYQYYGLQFLGLTLDSKCVSRGHSQLLCFLYSGSHRRFRLGTKPCRVTILSLCMRRTISLRDISVLRIMPHTGSGWHHHYAT
jgi:hypothetical protein